MTETFRSSSTAYQERAAEQLFVPIDGSKHSEISIVVVKARTVDFEEAPSSAAALS